MVLQVNVEWWGVERWDKDTVFDWTCVWKFYMEHLQIEKWDRTGFGGWGRWDGGGGGGGCHVKYVINHVAPKTKLGAAGLGKKNDGAALLWPRLWCASSWQVAKILPQNWHTDTSNNYRNQQKGPRCDCTRGRQQLGSAQNRQTSHQKMNDSTQHIRALVTLRY